MPYVEQAVFTSVGTDHSAGYRVVAKSPGVCEADAVELAAWGPSHDSMLDLDPDAVSLNFYPLPSGTFCISQTTHAGWEYGAHGGHRAYTQCLIVPTDVLGQFADNPFALIQAALADGMLHVYEQAPSRLEPLHLSATAAPVDHVLLARLATDPGAQQMAVLVQAVLNSTCVAVSGTPSAAELIAGLFSCLPIECRRAFSFSTGLKFSSHRAFRIIAVSDDPAEQQWVAHHTNVTVLRLSNNMPVPSMPIDGWAGLIGRVLASGRIPFLDAQLSKQRVQLTTDDLPALGLQLLEEFDASELQTDHQPGGENPAAPDGIQRAHAAHRQFEKSSGTATVEKIKVVGPSKTLQPATAEMLEKLERLDELVCEAIAGQNDAIEQLQTLWPQALAELDDEPAAESREQYMRYALSLWENCVNADGVRNPAGAVQALDVLCVLNRV